MLGAALVGFGHGSHDWLWFMPFPLTPALSLGERGSTFAALWLV